MPGLESVLRGAREPGLRGTRVGGDRGVAGTGGHRPDPTATSPVSWGFPDEPHGLGPSRGGVAPERTAQAQVPRLAEQRGARRPFIGELVTNTAALALAPSLETARARTSTRGGGVGWGRWRLVVSIMAPSLLPGLLWGLGEEPALGGSESPQGPPRPTRLCPHLPQAPVLPSGWAEIPGCRYRAPRPGLGRCHPPSGSSKGPGGQ